MNSLNEGLRRAAALAQRGDLAGARAQAQAAVAAQPNNAVALQFLGVLCCQGGDVARGAQHLRAALRLSPNDVALRLNLVRALLDIGQPGEALQICAAGPSSGPQSAEFSRVRGDILRAQDRQTEAMAAYRQSVAADPRNLEAWNNLGNALLDAGDSPGAIDALGRARSLDPNMALIRLNLGKALIAAERLPEALTELEAGARLAPQDAAILLELGRTLDRAGRSQEAIVALANAARLDRNNPEIFVAIGLAFATLGEFDRAEEAYGFALRADPGHPAALLNLGVLYEQSNRLEQLDTLIEGAVARGVTGDEIDCLRAFSLRREGRFREALDLILPVRSAAIDPRMRAQLEAQLADRLGEADIAFAAYSEMNAGMARDPAALAFDGTEHRKFVEDLARITTPEWFGSWPDVAVDTSPPAPVFLVGFPRSGTTLLDTVLMGHPDTHVLEEQPMLGRVLDEIGGIAAIPSLDGDQVNACRRRYFEELAAIDPVPPGKMVIDKMPLSVLRVAFIHRIFPGAKIIFAQRHPCDVVLSCFMQNFKINRAMASFLTLPNSALLHDRVLGYWQQVQQVFPLQAHTVRYESMVADLEGEVRPLLEFLGLPWDPKTLDHQSTAAGRGYIRTPSYAQVTEGIYLRSRGRWERYREHMADVLPVLAPWVRRLGYEPIDDAPAREQAESPPASMSPVQGISRDPRDMLAQARAALQSETGRDIIADVQATLRDHPGDAQLWLALGLLHRAEDDPGEAIAALDKAAELAPDQARIAHARALAHLDAGRPSAALFERAWQLAPADDAVRLGRTTALVADEGAAPAIAALEQELARTPLWAEGHGMLSRLRWMAGDHEGFTASLRQALAAAPGNVALWRELLVALMHGGRHQGLLEAIAAGRAAMGSHALFDANEAAVLDELGDLEAAAAMHARLGKPRDHAIAVSQVRHLLRRGDPVAAAALAEEWTRTPHGVLFWPYLSIAWRLTEDPRWAWLEGDERLVGAYDILDSTQTQELAQLLRSLHFAQQPPLDQSLRGGTQTAGALFARAEPEIRTLRAAVVAAVERHVAQLPPIDPGHPTLSLRRDRPIRFSGSWSVRLVDKGFHVSHVHPSGWFSSALYVALPDEMNAESAPAGWLALGAPPVELGIDLPPFRQVEPKPGRLALFPSTMWHGTVPFERGERLTVAFDVSPPR